VDALHAQASELETRDTTARAASTVMAEALRQKQNTLKQQVSELRTQRCRVSHARARIKGAVVMVVVVVVVVQWCAGKLLHGLPAVVCLCMHACLRSYICFRGLI
jgi:hypothetical protein